MTSEPIRLSIEEALRETRGEIKKSPAAVAQYTAERAAHLATLVGKPGFEQAWRIEQSNVLAFAEIEVTRQGWRVNDQLAATVRTALLFAARAAARV